MGKMRLNESLPKYEDRAIRFLLREESVIHELALGVIERLHTIPCTYRRRSGEVILSWCFIKPSLTVSTVGLGIEDALMTDWFKHLSYTPEKPFGEPQELIPLFNNLLESSDNSRCNPVMCGGVGYYVDAATVELPKFPLSKLEDSPVYKSLNLEELYE